MSVPLESVQTSSGSVPDCLKPLFWEGSPGRVGQTAVSSGGRRLEEGGQGKPRDVTSTAPSRGDPDLLNLGSFPGASTPAIQRIHCRNRAG